MVMFLLLQRSLAEKCQYILSTCKADQEFKFQMLSQIICDCKGKVVLIIFEKHNFSITVAVVSMIGIAARALLYDARLQTGSVYRKYIHIHTQYIGLQ